MGVACNNYYHGVLMIIFYFFHLCLLIRILNMERPFFFSPFLYSFNNFYQYGLMDYILFYELYSSSIMFCVVFQLWLLGALSQCPFDLLLSLFEHFLTFWYLKMLQDILYFPCSSFGTNQLSKNSGSF